MFENNYVRVDSIIDGKKVHRGHNKNEVTRRARHLPSIYVQGNTWSRDGQEWKWNMICDPRASDARAGLIYK